MTGILRTFRRRPARIAVSVLAMALALTAIGVLGVPGVAQGSLRRSAELDRLAHLSVDVTDTASLAPVAAVPGVAAVEGEVVHTVRLADGDALTLVGADWGGRAVDVLRPESGRLPVAPDEVVVGPDGAGLGDTIDVAGRRLEVVGVGDTTAWAEATAAYVPLGTARAIAGIGGYDHLSVRADDTGAEALDDLAASVREALRAEGATFTSFPLTLPGGRHPIEDDLTVVSTMIGLLGIVAGLVALVLLASTANTLVTEQTREVAVMRALGARRRTLRRRLRRQAIVLAGFGALLGIPGGVVVANVVARMVLSRFAGITPGIGFSPVVMAASLGFALVGARLVSARAARRVTAVPLVEALRDRDGAPYGRRLGDRLVVRLTGGRPTTRLGLRGASRRRARSLALTVQVAAAVAAAVTVATLAASVVAFNGVEGEPWHWEREATPLDPSFPYRGAVGPDAEIGIETLGEIGDWDVDVYGVDVDTRILDSGVDAGRWLSGRPGEAVLAESFARRTGVAVGDTITVDLSAGPSTFRVVGLHPVRARAVIVERTGLAGVLGVGGGNVVWSGATDGAALAPAATSQLSTRADQYAEDEAARNAILAIFGAIGLIVVAVAALSVASGTGVALWERRHELAALRASGARARTLRRIVLLELLPLVVVGWAVGVAGGLAGGHLVMGVFEDGNAIDIGTEYALGVVPVALAVAVGGALLIARVGVRGTMGASPAAVLRTSA